MTKSRIVIAGAPIWIAIILVCLASSMPAQRISWRKSWSEAVATAAREKKPLLLAVTGDRWSSLSRRFSKSVLGNSDVMRRIGSSYVCYRIDLPVAKRGRVAEMSEGDRKLLVRTGIVGHQGLPRVLIFTTAERVFGRLGPPCDPKDFLADLEEWERAFVETSRPAVDKETAARLAASANSLRVSKDYVPALADAEAAIKANPGEPKAHFTRGLILTEMGRHADSRTSYFNALSLDSTGNPADAKTTIWAAGSWYNIAVMELRDGNDQRAIFFLRENQRTDAQTDGPMKRIIEIESKAGRAGVALEEQTELLFRSGLSASYLKAYKIYEQRVLGGK